MNHSENNLLIEVRNLKKYFPIKKGVFTRTKNFIRAVDDVSFHIHREESFGLVGESGSGKTTLGRTILRLIEPTAGEVIFDNKNIFQLRKSELRKLRRKMQIIFQDPVSSLNPRMTIGKIIGEGLVLHKLVKTKKDLQEKIAYLLEQVGLSENYISRYPHEFSGGQRQRIGIARALAVNPEFIVADEPVSALDVSIQAQILNLLSELREKFHLSFLFIAHNLAVVEHFCDTVGIMYLGRLLELAPADKIYSSPIHPYTQMLIEAVPEPEPKKRREFEQKFSTLSELSMQTVDKGCPFAPRCPYVEDRCREENQELKSLSSDNEHKVACWKFCK